MAKGLARVKCTGHLLYRSLANDRSKAQLPHGEFEAMVKEDLPFSPRTAQRLKAIAEDSRISNTTYTSLLPSSWYTLYELTTLGDADFQTAIKNGTICPDMTRV